MKAKAKRSEAKRRAKRDSNPTRLMRCVLVERTYFRGFFLFFLQFVETTLHRKRKNLECHFGKSVKAGKKTRKFFAYTYWNDAVEKCGHSPRRSNRFSRLLIYPHIKWLESWPVDVSTRIGGLWLDESFCDGGEASRRFWFRCEITCTFMELHIGRMFFFSLHLFSQK